MRNVDLKIVIFSFICLSPFLLENCYDENRVKGGDVNQRIQVLIEAKATSCGNRPSYPLFFTRDASPSEVDLCEKEMINKKCPFNSYPWSCVRIF